MSRYRPKPHCIIGKITLRREWTAEEIQEVVDILNSDEPAALVERGYTAAAVFYGMMWATMNGSLPTGEAESFVCPIEYPDCQKNCGSYGCGN